MCTNLKSATMGRWSDGNSEFGSAVSAVTDSSGGMGMDATDSRADESNQT